MKTINEKFKQANMSQRKKIEKSKKNGRFCVKLEVSVNKDKKYVAIYTEETIGGDLESNAGFHVSFEEMEVLGLYFKEK